MGLGINVAFSFFMKIIHVCMYTRTQVHTYAKSFRWTCDLLHKEVQAQSRLRARHTRGGLGIGAGCAASHFYL